MEAKAAIFIFWNKRWGSSKISTFKPRGQSVLLMNYGIVHHELCSELPTLRNTLTSEKKPK